MKVENVPISSISVVENVRVKIKATELVQLMESIKQSGLLHPIGVCIKEGNGVLIYGHRRLEACRKLGWKDIPAVILGDLPIQETIVTNLVENLMREEVTPAELGRSCDVLNKRYRLTVAEIASKLSFPVTKIKLSLDLYRRLGSAMRDKVAFGDNGKVQAGKISATTAMTIINMKKSHQLSEHQVQTLMEDARFASLSNRDIETVAALISSGKSPKAAIKEKGNYVTQTVTAILHKEEFDTVVSKEKITGGEALRRTIYGDLKPFKKPVF